MRRLALTSLWCAVALCSVGGRATAHDFPTPFRLLFDANQPERIVVLLRPGVLFSEDRGSAWSFVCGAASGIAGGDSYPALLAGSRLLVGGYVGLYRDDGFGCSWSRVESSGLPAGRIVSLLAHDDGSVRALVAPAQGPAAMFVSRDEGQSWTALGLPLMAARPRALARAPGAADRLYVLDAQPTAAALWVSDDAGQHWQERARLAPECSEILGVDPSDADRSYVGCGDRVLVSADAAHSFETWAELPDIGGFAIAPDGRSRWIGSRTGGLWRQDGAGELQLLHERVHVGCLQFSDDTLWVCARDERGYDAYALATSRDAGETLTPFLRSLQVSRLRTCGNPTQAATCGNEWNQWQSDVALTAAEQPEDAGVTAARAPDAGPAAATNLQPSAAETSCAVHQPGVLGSSRFWLGLCVMSGLLATVRRRAKRRMTALRESGMRVRSNRRTPWQPSSRFPRATTRSPHN